MRGRAWREIFPDLYCYRDCCNVYLLRDANRGLVIDCGSASFMEHIAQIGVTTIDWVVFTHHHREQCQGANRLSPDTRIAVPGAEVDLFSTPETHWQNPAHRSVVGCSYVRPLREGITVHRALGPWEDFEWGPYRLIVYPTPGNSPGAISLMTTLAGHRICFSGDLMLERETLHTYYDSEWDYGELSGITALKSSALRVAQDGPDILCPSHGDVVTDAATRLKRFAARLESFANDLLRRDYDQSLVDVWPASAPTGVGGIRRLSDHLLKGPGNLAIILADSGKALFVDCGVLLPASDQWLSAKLDAMEAHLGLKTVDAVVVTHYHGDHLLDIPVVIGRYGSQVWAFENFAEILRHPERYNLAATLPAYNRSHQQVPVDRVLSDGESFQWEQFELTALHLPGQTEYSMGLLSEIDGRRVLFSGDNIWYSPAATGHASFIAHNSAVPENGYLKCADQLITCDPDLIIGGHGQEIPEPAQQIREFHRWSRAFRSAIGRLSHNEVYEYSVDPFWCRFHPFRLDVAPGRRCRTALMIRNYAPVDVDVSGTICCPAGWSASPRRRALVVPAGQTGMIPVTLRVGESAQDGVYPVTADLHRGDEYLGEYPECLVRVHGTTEALTPARRSRRASHR